jgi:hypothetical protein
MGYLCGEERMTGFEWLFAAPVLAETAAAGGAFSGASIASGMAAGTISGASGAILPVAAGGASTFQTVAQSLQAIGTLGQMLSGVNQAGAASAYSKEEARSEIISARARANASERHDLAVAAKGRAFSSASGLDPDSGSALSSYLTSIGNMAANKQDILNEGYMRANQKKTIAKYYKQQIPGLLFEGSAKLAGQYGSWLKRP